MKNRENPEESYLLVGLFVNGKKEAETKIHRFISLLETIVSLKDGAGTSVDPENELPFEYTGRIREITFHAAPYEFETQELFDEFWAMD